MVVRIAPNPVRIVVRVAPLIALLAFVAELSLRPMAESDLFFRIKAGQEILASHGLPGRNLFSFTYPDHPDIDAAWLFEVAAAALHARGGFPAVVVAKTVVLLAAFAAAFWLCRRRGAGAAASALALAAAAYVGRERFVERPHIFSLLGAVGLLAAIDALTASTGRRAARVAIATCAGVALWANLHAGAFVAPLVLACAAAGARIDRRWGPSKGPQTPPLRDRTGAARRLGLTALGAAAAVFATPIGAGLLGYLRLHLTLPALHPVDEFRAPSWLSDPALFVYGAGLVWRRPSPGAAVRPGPRCFPRWSSRRSPSARCASPPTSPGHGAPAGCQPHWWWPIGCARAGRGCSRADPVGGRGRADRGARRRPAHGGVGRAAGFDLDTRELPLSAIAFVNAHGLRDPDVQ
jgi:hypothetical protein